MQLALCRCKASKTEDICIYFEGFATKQMHKDNGKLHPNLGVYFFGRKSQPISGRDTG